MRAYGGRMKALLSVAAVGFSVIVAGFAWFYGGAVRCDESCSVTAASWSESWDAWQWSLIMWLGVALLAFALATALAASRGRRRLATASVALWAGAAVVLCDLITSSSSEVGPDLWLWLALGFVLMCGFALPARPRA
jgi:hypothetical protein